MVLCAGCGEKQGEFQCPLCQATELDGGYFCSQECFAKNFVVHRDATHGSGTVRTKRSTADKAAEAERETAKRVAKKRAAVVDTQTLSATAAARDESKTAAELMPTAEDFSDEDEHDAYTQALQKELAKRSPLPLWPVWPGADVIGRATAAGEEKRSSSSAVASMTEPPLRVPAKGQAWGRLQVCLPAAGSVADFLHLSAVFAVQTALEFVARSTNDAADTRVVIVSQTAAVAHAVMWAARCRRTRVACLVATQDVRPVEAQLGDFAASEQQIVVASVDALASNSEALDASATVSVIMRQAKAALIITLPDVIDAEILQPLTASALFITKHAAADVAPASPAATAETPAKKGSRGGAKQPAAPAAAATTTPTLVVPAPQVIDVPTFDVAGHTPKANEAHDSRLSYLLLVRGDIPGAIAYVTRLYNESKANCEHVLHTTLLQDWGAASVVHAHHRLAVLLRLLVEASIKMSTSTRVRDPLSLAHIAARCIVRTVKHLPALDAEATPCEPVVLDATLCYCFSHIPKAITDELAEQWGLAKIGVIGTGALGHPDRLRAVALHRVRTMFGPRFGTTTATFMGILHHCIADAAIRHPLSVKDVRAASLWDWACAPFGDLADFLNAAQLVHRAEDMTSASGYTRAGAKISKSKLAANKAGSSSDFVTEATIVAQHPLIACPKIKRLQWPIQGARERRRKLMRGTALDELLSAMPSSKNVPMYLGDIGHLIGKWTAYNARFGGYLPTTLQQFIEEHPEQFRIVGNLVSRVNDSVTQQIRIRFDNEEFENDSDDERRKRNRAEKSKISKADFKTRRGRKAAEKKLFEDKPNMPRRSIKKKLRLLRNQSRFNKNHKQLDASARVPGYNKPTPKKLSGRGKKKNARLVKRSG